jgi:hypothetical protein
MSESQKNQMPEIGLEDRIAFFRLTQADDNRESLLVRALTGQIPKVRTDLSRFNFRAIADAPLSYWVLPSIFRVFRDYPTLQKTVADAKLGAHTGEDARLVRYHWEVSSQEIGRKRKWVRFAKGGEFSRFYSDIYLLVGWDDSSVGFRKSAGVT